MGRHKVWRYGALTMAAVLGFGTIFSGKVLENKVFADNGDTVTTVFAEGHGTGADFSEENWVFAGKEKPDGSNVELDVMQEGAGRAPGIEKDNKYLKTDEKVIRLINGVKAGSDRSTGLEDYRQKDGKDLSDASYSAYRSGEAFLKNGIQLKPDAEFAVKFTFSMPEAVVNTTQTGGAEYAREVGGDGIAFVMTTNETHKTQAGSGIGYQGIEDSISVELDSYFNGAYAMTSGMGGADWSNAYTNWGFDNQLYFHTGAGTADGGNTYGDINSNPYANGYENYVNPDFAERFDHIAITKDGDVKKHLAKYYINKIDPTELVDGEYVNLANRYKSTNTTTSKNLPRKTGSTDESNSPTCATRFADKGVDTRLFTVWIDYADNKMNVSIANGDFVNAVKPATPQITNTVNLDNFDGKEVYMGFTSAVGSSKANHTIHSFSFSNVSEATYKLNYYLKDKTTGEYKLDKSTDIFTGEVGTTATAESIDSVYKDAYKDANYVLSTKKDQETSVKLEEKGKLYEMNLYYDPAEAYYKLNYYKYDTTKNEYVLQETTDTVTDYVGKKATINDVDSKYATKYPNYKVNMDKKDDFEVTLTEAGKTYEMNVYYDPEKAGYKLNYHKKNPVTGEYEYIESSDVSEGILNETYQVTDVDKDYKTKYEKDGYVINESKNETYSVKIEEENKTYEMNVYYDPAEAYYLVNYYVYDSEKGEYVLRESTPKTTSYVGAETNVGQVDPNYGSKYPGYSVNAEKNQDYAVKLTEAGKTYEMNVYYDPDTAGYKLNYHKLNPNTGNYEYQESTKVFEGNVNETYKVTDADANYETKYQKDNYVVNPEKNETYSVKIEEENKTYEMDVYYDPVKTTYKTEYYLKNPDGSYTLKDTVPGEETYAGKNVTAPEKSYDGYVHVTTPDSKESAVVEADGSTTMKVYFDPEKKPTYKVEYYVEQPDGSYKLYTEKKDIEADAGSKVDAEIISIPGYEHTITTNTKESDTVLADSSTVLKVYYNLVVEPTPTPTENPNYNPTEPTEEPIETPEPEETEEPEEPVEPEETEEPEEPLDIDEPKAPAPKTNDSNHAGAYFALMISSIVVFGITLLGRKKENDEK